MYTILNYLKQLMLTVWTYNLDYSDYFPLVTNKKKDYVKFEIQLQTTYGLCGGICQTMKKTRK